VQLVAPDLVSTTSAYLNASDTAPTTLFEVNYGALPFVLINAVKEIASVSGVFEQNLIAWLGNASNGIVDLFAQNGHFVSELCVGSTCVTPTQFQAIVAAANQTGGGASPGSSSSSGQGTTDASSTPPVIQINGNNPAVIQVGATYTDLGATITGPQADLNLGITTYLNGTPVSIIVIDTTQAATDTIDYVVTDQNGLTSTSTRTVIIQSANDNQAPSTPANDNTTPSASSTTEVVSSAQ
jgi:hypothetical protein